VAGWVVGRRADRLRFLGDRYRELSEHDPLTGLANARVFFARYRRAVEHARRFREPLSLLLIDVDHLKESNDRFGHAFGSAVLLHVAEIVSLAKREDDMAARWGGDEFALLMPGAESRSARERADEIEAVLRRAPLERGGSVVPVSVTIGVATRTGDFTPGEADLFESADAALYEGKREGRGRVRS
jgi:two-component system cell cycle response regulator